MRLPRLDFPGARHHVMNRTAHGRAVFDGGRADALFLELLADLPRRFGVRVHGYALMPNHYHLLVTSDRGELSRAMRYLGSEFTRRLNRLAGGEGPVFRGRFHNRIVDTEAYWLHALLYVHLNPVRAGLSSAEVAAGTSHQAYLGQVEVPEWLDVASLREAFGTAEAYLEAYQGVLGGTLALPDGFDPERFWAPNRTGSVTAPSPAGYPLADALKDVSQVTGLDVDALLTTPRGRNGNPANWLAAWWMQERGIDHGSIRRAMHVTHSTVSLRIRRVEERRHSDAQLRAWTDALVQRWMEK